MPWRCWSLCTGLPLTVWRFPCYSTTVCLFCRWVLSVLASWLEEATRWSSLKWGQVIFLNKNHGVQYSSTDYWRIAQCQFLIFKQKMFWPLSSLVDRQWPLNLFEIRWTLFELTSGICDLKLSPKTFSLSLDTIFSVLRQQMLILPKWICTILTLYKCFSFILRMLYR